jgi:hypothetical protein
VNFRCALAWLACDWEECGNCAHGDGCEFDLLVGWRGMRYHNQVTIDEAVTPLTPANPSTNRIGVRDSFDVHNIFNGGQVGLTGRFRYRGFFFDGRGTLAVGQRLARVARVQILGVTDRVQATGITTVPGGLLASRTNIGFYNDEDVGFVTQMDLRVGYHITDNLIVSAGYTFLHMSSMVQAGGLIDVRFVFLSSSRQQRSEGKTERAAKNRSTPEQTEPASRRIPVCHIYIQPQESSS